MLLKYINKLYIFKKGKTKNNKITKNNNKTKKKTKLTFFEKEC